MLSFHPFNVVLQKIFRPYCCLIIFFFHSSSRNYCQQVILGLLIASQKMSGWSNMFWYYVNGGGTAPMSVAGSEQNTQESSVNYCNSGDNNSNCTESTGTEYFPVPLNQPVNGSPSPVPPNNYVSVITTNPAISILTRPAALQQQSAVITVPPTNFPHFQRDADIPAKLTQLMTYMSNVSAEVPCVSFDPALLSDAQSTALGNGSFGYVRRVNNQPNTVFKYALIEQRHLDRNCNERTSPPDATIREIRKLTLLRDNANIVRIYSFFVPDKDRSLAGQYIGFNMEYADQGTLSTLMIRSMERLKRKEGTEFSWVLALCWMRDILSGLQYMHSMQEKHKDLKPSNILAFTNTTMNRIVLKIGDCGLSRNDASSKSVEKGLGTQGYKEG